MLHTFSCNSSPLKAYDPKRSCWVPVKGGGFSEGTIETAEGDKVTVRVGKDERKVLKKDQVQQVRSNNIFTRLVEGCVNTPTFENGSFI